MRVFTCVNKQELYRRATLADYNYSVLNLLIYDLLGLPKFNFLGVKGFCSLAKTSPLSLVREENEHQSGIEGSRM